MGNIQLQFKTVTVISSFSFNVCLSACLCALISYVGFSSLFWSICFSVCQTDIAVSFLSVSIYTQIDVFFFFTRSLLLDPVSQHAPCF